MSTDTDTLLTPAEVARLRLIPWATSARKVRKLCESSSIDHHWNHVEGSGARYALSRAQIDAYLRKTAIRAVA